MFYFIDASLTDRYNEMLRKQERPVTTFIMSMDDHDERMKSYRRAELFLSDFGRADRDLKGMPVLLIREGRKANRVLVQIPDGVWADVTDASEIEVSRLSMGAVGADAKLAQMVSALAATARFGNRPTKITLEITRR